MANVKLTSKFISANGKRCGVRYSVGPWIEGVNPDTIKVRPVNRYFPDEIAREISVTNNTDTMTDYFEADCLVLVPGHPLYNQAKMATAS